MRGAWLMAVVVLAARPAMADLLVVDLGVDDTLTFPVAPGAVRVRIHNRLTGMNYNVTVRREAIPIDPLPRVDLSRLAGGGDCGPVLSLVKDIEGAADEKKVAEITAKIRAEVGGAHCSPEEVQAIEAGLARAESEVGTFDLRAGEQLTIVVARGDGKKTWTRVATAGARGRWEVSYGAAMFPDRDEVFFARAKGDSKYEVAQEEHRDGYKVAPAIFFTWLPASRQLRNWSWGPTAGLGVKSDRPTVFAGWSVTYNWNLSLIVGAGLVSESRLNGRYKADPPQELTENLTADQLNQKVYQLRWMAAVVFRFGSNPFEGGSTAATPEKKDKKK